ncbi:MAG: WG repeat-containing protein [Flavobacteriales bacterium]|nr:WG repeat-containing protein [Flavobacteriales bacterium]MBK9537756.1 WG repeat-containing protein [Flavobacteriales bacterium]
MRTCLTLTLSVFLATCASAQTLLVQVRLADSARWGYANEKGELVIPPAYKHCYRFSESGYAAVVDTTTQKGGFIDTKGERLKTEVREFELIAGPFRTDIQGFACGLAAVKVGEKWGFMNTEGKLAVPAKYDKVDAFDGCHTVVEIAKKKYILSSDGKEAPIADANVVDVKSFVEGLAPFVTADKKHGFMDGDQKVVIPAQYMGVGYFSDGLAWAKDAGKKVGFIDKTGRWVIEPKYEAATDMDPVSGMARVKDGAATFYVDRDGNELHVNYGKDLGPFREGLADAWGEAIFLVDKEGVATWVRDTTALQVIQNDVVKVKRVESLGFIDKKGSWVIQPQFEATRSFKNGYCAVKQGELWGMIDRTGKWVIEPKFEGIKDMELVR